MKDEINSLTLIASATIKNCDICVFRDRYGKWYIKNNGYTSQKRLTTKEIVCYLVHAGQDRGN